MIDLIHGLWNNKVKIIGGYAALWYVSPRAAELITRLAYGFASEQVRTSAQFFKDVVSVATRPKGTPRPPIIPPRDIAAIRGVGSAAINLSRKQASRLALRTVPVLAAPSTAVIGLGLGSGFVISHGIGQLPHVNKTATIGQRYVMGAPI